MKLITKEDIDSLKAFVIVLIIAVSGFAFIIGIAIDNNIVVYISLIPLAIFVLGFLYLLIGAYTHNSKSKREKAVTIKSWDKIKVNLDDLNIKSNSWKQEVTRGSGVRERNEHIDAYQNFITLTIEHKNRTLYYETMLSMEPEILRIHLTMKGQTILYIDPVNESHYLDFLYSS